MGVFAEQTKSHVSFFEERVKKSKAVKGRSDINLKNRLSNDNYLKSLNSSSPQAVLKIISKALGSRQITNVLDYVCREKEEEKLYCEDDNGTILKDKEARKELLEKWEGDFLSKESYEKQAWKLEEIHRMERRLEILGYKKDKRIISFSELAELVHLEDCIAEKFKYVDNSKVLKKRLEEQERVDELICEQEEKGSLPPEKSEELTNLQKSIEWSLKNTETKIDLKMRGVSDTTHIMLSVGGKPDIEKATEATRNFLQENFKGAGFRFVFVRHNDTDNLHFHVVVHNRSLLEKDKRLYFDKADLFILRKEYSRHLTNFGITRESTLRKDRPNVLEKIQKGIETIRENNSWFQEKILSGEKQNKNFYMEKSSMLRQIQNSINSLEYEKKNKILGKGQHNKLLKELRSLKQEIERASNENFAKITKDAISYLSKQESLLFKKRLTNEQNHQHQKEHLKEYLQKHAKEIKEARDDLMKNTKVKTAKERLELEESLKILSKLLENTKSKSKER